MEDQAYFYGTGRRKTAIARVKIMPGRGAIVINGIPYEELLTRIEHRSMVTKPLIVTDNLGKFNVVVTTVGGGTSGQAGAICMGIARALLKANAENRLKLKRNGLLTRDPRAKERKKAGLRKARKAPQYTKR
ncbi:MAG TPA: 30S ribosomal protein S9 [Dehalococcoidales bacterium]|nr:30S ribosomal protein S9 [Dehalococcoidales bacterium]